MRHGTDGRSARVRTGVYAAIVTLALLSSAPGLAAEYSPTKVEAALDSAVRIEITLRWQGNTSTADFSGSGWTRACQPTAEGFLLVVATAGHVVDVAALEEEVRPQQTPLHSTVSIVLVYRDGRQYTANLEDIRVDRVHDYGEIRVRSSVVRTVLPAGVAAAVAPGAHLFSIASPGLLAYGYFEGALIEADASMVANAPAGAWLTSIQVSPGASGAPVLDDDGRVVATVVGLVQWPLGGQASVIVPLPMEIPAVQQTAMEVDVNNPLGQLMPLLRLGGTAGVALGVSQLLLGLFRRQPFTTATLQLVTSICEKAVAAIEQANPTLAGVDKKQLAQKLIGQILSHYGISVPAALIEAGLESAVRLLAPSQTTFTSFTFDSAGHVQQAAAAEPSTPPTQEPGGAS